MFNNPECYTEVGRKAAEARNQGDESRAHFHAAWFRRARAYEQGEDKYEADRLYHAAYKEARHV